MNPNDIIMNLTRRISEDEQKMLYSLLCCCMPRVKEKEALAETLLYSFGCFDEVLKATDSELSLFPEITPHAIQRLLFFKALYLYRLSYLPQYKEIPLYPPAPSEDGTEPEHVETIKDYFYAISRYEKQEIFRVALLDENLILRKWKTLQVGSPARVPLDFRQVLDYAVRNKYPNVVLIHNHPNAAAADSQPDAVLTSKLMRTLQPHNRRLVDHIIVGRDGAIWMSRESKHNCHFDF